MENRAFNMDCMEAMRSMQDQCFDLAVVDPPYGIRISNNMGWRKGERVPAGNGQAEGSRPLPTMQKINGRQWQGRGPGMPGPYGRWPGAELLPVRADMESAPMCVCGFPAGEQCSPLQGRLYSKKSCALLRTQDFLVCTYSQPR